MALNVGEQEADNCQIIEILPSNVDCDDAPDSPKVQTFMLSTLMDESEGTIITEKGESVYMVMLPSFKCSHCLRTFQSQSEVDGKFC